MAELNWKNPVIREHSVVINRKWPSHLSVLLLCLLILALVYPAAQPVNASYQIREKALLVWVYDASESMSTMDVQKDGVNISRLDASVLALEESLGEIPPDIHKILISFSGREEISVGLPTLDNAELLKQAQTIVRGERTATDFGLEQAFSACRQFFNNEDNHPCVVFLLSDGECNPRPQCRTRSEELTVAARDKGITVHAISWGDPESDFRPNPRDMEDIAQAGHGQHLVSAQTSELTKLYSNVAKGFNVQTVYQALSSPFVWGARIIIALITLIFFLRKME